MIVGAFILVTIIFVLVGVGFYIRCTKRPDPQVHDSEPEIVVVGNGNVP